jgi:hypothetical protein
MVFLSDTANFSMANVIGFPFIWEKFLGIFGFHQAFTDWLPVFIISTLQSILIGLIVVLWQKKRGKEKSTNAENVGSAGLITGLIALGAGCPTCGVTLLTPIIGMFASAGTALIVGTVSRIVTVVAVIIAIFSLKRLGEEAYVQIINEKYLKKKATRKIDEDKKDEEKDTNKKHSEKRASKNERLTAKKITKSTKKE